MESEPHPTSGGLPRARLAPHFARVSPGSAAAGFVPISEGLRDVNPADDKRPAPREDPAPPGDQGLCPALDRRRRLAPRRRRLHRRDRLAGLRALGHSDGALARRRRLDAAAGRLRPRRRGRQRPVRPAPDHDRRRPRARCRGRRHRGALAHAGHSSSGTCSCSRPSSGRATRSSGPAFNAIVPQIVPRGCWSRRTRSTSSSARSSWRSSAGARRLDRGRARAGGEPSRSTRARSSFRRSRSRSFAARPLAGPAEEPTSALADMREGFASSARTPWLWGTLARRRDLAARLLGPGRGARPFRIKNELGGGADDFGLVLAAGGVGSIVAAVVMAQRGLPRRHMTFMYIAWAVGCSGIAGLASRRSSGRRWRVSFVSGAFTAGLIVWGTLIQTLVPARLLGRVTSLDWLVSTRLVPVSFALTGPGGRRPSARRRRSSARA